MTIDPPEGAEDLTAAWLGAALAQVGHRVTVADVVVDEVGTGQTGSSYRLTVTYAESTDLPLTFVAKVAATDPAVRQRVSMSYRAEVAFYRVDGAGHNVPVNKGPREDFRNHDIDAVAEIWGFFKRFRREPATWRQMARRKTATQTP